jgi:hypothetical protein
MNMNTAKTRIDWSVKPLNKSKTARDCREVISAVRAEEIKSDLVERLAAEYAELSPRLVYQAVNEAHALASLTQVPHLVLPTLAEEKVQKVAAWAAHQRAVRGGEQFAFAA